MDQTNNQPYFWGQPPPVPVPVMMVPAVVPMGYPPPGPFLPPAAAYVATPRPMHPIQQPPGGMYPAAQPFRVVPVVPVGVVRPPMPPPPPRAPAGIPPPRPPPLPPPKPERRPLEIVNPTAKRPAVSAAAVERAAAAAAVAAAGLSPTRDAAGAEQQQRPTSSSRASTSRMQMTDPTRRQTKGPCSMQRAPAVRQLHIRCRVMAHSRQRGHRRRRRHSSS